MRFKKPNLFSAARASPHATARAHGTRHRLRNINHLSFGTWNFEIFAYLDRKQLVDFTMTGNCCNLARHGIDVYGVISAFPSKLTAMRFKMTQ